MGWVEILALIRKNKKAIRRSTERKTKKEKKKKEPCSPSEKCTGVIITSE